MLFPCVAKVRKKHLPVPRDNWGEPKPPLPIGGSYLSAGKREHKK